MNRQDHKTNYQSWFLKHESGQHFLDSIRAIENGLLVKAKENPEESRDYVQQMKGIDRVANHIRVMIAEVKKGKK